MKKTFLILLATVASLLAEEPTKPPMTRIEFQAVTPTIPAPGQPMVRYIAGKTYARSERQPDPARRIPVIVICAEPDIWMIDPVTRTGKHVLDPGPNYVVYNNILNGDLPKALEALEFGKELEFFKNPKATALEPQSLDGQRCTVSELKLEGYRAVLFVREDSRLPFHLDVFKDGTLTHSVRYLKYQTRLPFDPALFAPPADVKITEAKPTITK